MRFRLTTILLCLAFSTLSPDTSSATRSKFDSENWVRAEVNTLVAAARAAFEDDDALPAYHKALAAISRAIRRHRLDQNEGFVSRHREFIEYVRMASIDQLPDHELGFDVSDQQYFRETSRYVEIPDFLLNRRFLSSVSRWETLDRAKEFLREINSTREPANRLSFFSFTSRHLGTPDNDDSYRRLLIVVPGNTETGIPEKWVQFGVTDPGTRNRTRNLSVVSAVPTGDGTFNTYFKDYFRTYRRGGSISIKGRWELGYGDDNCARCHKSGVLPIFPEEGSVNPNELPAIEEVNRRFRTYGSPRFDKYLDESKFGPGLGSGNSVERNKRFGERFSETVVGRSMNCVVCHRPERLGYLNWPMEQIVISSYIKGGHMPLGNDLKETEREELYEKIIEEYFAIDDANPGILKSWLLGDSLARSFQKDGK
ncbi:MAG TPA: hypothetical protein VN937_07440 [Blastocatellia bacterium]|nr:hypothetical protein [Blastocatellia bacterium]